MSCTKPKMTKVQMKVSNSRTCRVCMRKNISMKELFGSDSKIVDRIQFCTGILFTENPILPSFICTKCLSQLDIAHNFKTTCITTEEILKKLNVKVEIKKEMDDTTVKEETEDLYEDEAEVEIDCKEDVSLLIEESSNSTKKIVTPSLSSTKKVVKQPPLNSTTNTKKLKDKCKEKEEDLQKTVPSIIFRKLYCSKCDIRFETKEESLEHHERLHNILKFVCEFCGKQFLYQGSHHSHMRIHIGPSLQCAHCSYTTVNKSDLKTHITLHTGEKKFHCHACPGTFRTSSNLLNHIKHNHGGKKTFHCDRCDKSFYNGPRLRRHMDAHNNIKRHECPVCHSCFTRRCHWKSHLLKQHAIQTPPAKLGRPGTGRLAETPSLLDTKINVQKCPIPDHKRTGGDARGTATSS